MNKNETRRSRTRARTHKKVIHNIPLAYSTLFSNMSGASIYLKCENLQKTGSFKIRGAFTKISKLSEEGNLNGVITASAGNHAQGVAFASTKIGVKSIVVMPKSTPLPKILATKGYGAEVVLHGDCYDDAYQKATEIMASTGMTFIHPYDDEDTIAGQGTIGLELLKELTDVDVVFVPAGGGGLLSGIAFAIKNINPNVKVIGVQSSGADAIVSSFYSKKLITTSTVSTIADGIAVKIPGGKTMELINKYVDEMVTVTDKEISATVLYLLERSKMLVEPAGAASVAASIYKKVNIVGKKTICVISGGNIDISMIQKIIEKGLLKRNRNIQFEVILPDTPEALADVSLIIGSVDAKIYSLHHNRMDTSLKYNEAALVITCQVSDAEHGEKLLTSISERGYRIVKRY